MRFVFPALLVVLAGLAASRPAHAKSSTWWDCFFREFEHCSGNDPDAPDAASGANAQKSFCDSKARIECDEEERQNQLKVGGHSANEKNGKGSTILTAPAEAKPSKPDEVLASPSDAVVEGNAPSGDNTVLGVDVTLSISQMAETYRGRNVRGCHPIDDAFSRTLCLDAPGASGGAPIELDFYRGRLVGLSYEAKTEAGVRFKPAVAVAEDKTGAKAQLSPGSDLPARVCVARLPLGGGALVLQGQPADLKDDACSAANVESAQLLRVEWAPSMAAQREIASQRKADGNPAQRKREELERAKALLPL